MQRSTDDLDRLDLLDLGSKEGRPANLQGLVLAHALVEGGILVLALAVGAEAGGRGPSLFDAPALALRKGPGLAHPEGLGLDRDPDLVLALPLIQGADQALWRDPGLVLQPGVGPLLKALSEARAQSETIEDPSFINFFPHPLLYPCLHFCLEFKIYFSPICLHDQHGHCLQKYR